VEIKMIKIMQVIRMSKRAKRQQLLDLTQR